MQRCNDLENVGYIGVEKKQDPDLQYGRRTYFWDKLVVEWSAVIRGVTGQVNINVNLPVRKV